MNNKIPARVFLDVNVLFDVVNTKAKQHQSCVFLLNTLLTKGIIIYVSPTGFAINFYLITKLLRNKNAARIALLKMYGSLRFSREDYIIMDKVMKSDFEDLEDAIQYFSAQDAGVDCIITNNIADFPKKGIPIYAVETFFYTYLYN